MTDACLSSGRSEFKTCPNCRGDGYEDTPPMRRCGVCKGKGRVPDAPATKDMGHQEKTRSAPRESLCYHDQGAV